MSGIRCNPKLRRDVMDGKEPAWLLAHPRRSYVRAAILANVDWRDRAKIKAIYADAKARGLVVDHEIPLCHPYVCGLHVHANLRAVPWAVNASRGNKWTPDQLEFEL